MNCIVSTGFFFGNHNQLYQQKKNIRWYFIAFLTFKVFSEMDIIKVHFIITFWTKRLQTQNSNKTSSFLKPNHSPFLNHVAEAKQIYYKAFLNAQIYLILILKIFLSIDKNLSFISIQHIFRFVSHNLHILHQHH